MEIVELEDYFFFVGVQYYFEFLFRFIKFFLLYFGFFLVFVGWFLYYFQKGCRFLFRDIYSDRSGSSFFDFEIIELKFLLINYD